MKQDNSRTQRSSVVGVCQDSTDVMEFYSASNAAKCLGKERSTVKRAIKCNTNTIYKGKRYKPEYI